MKETFETKLQNGNLQKAKKHNYEVIQVGGQDVAIVRIESSKLSFDDEFMMHEPKNEREQELKKLLADVIDKVILDFYRPIMDPSFGKPKKDEDWRYAWMEENTLSYKEGGVPAIRGIAYPRTGSYQSYSSWKDLARNFCWPRSRIGTKDEYIAFLGVLIKKMIKEGWSVDEAWDAVCNDSKKLGHYCDSIDSKGQLERTGSREICGFFDLANTYKLLAGNPEKFKDYTGFWLAGGCYGDRGDEKPIATLCHMDCQFSFLNNCVGWIVLSR